MILFILHLVVYFILYISKDEGIKWMIIVVCEEGETIKKIKKILYFNEILCKIDNLMQVF